MMPYRKLKFMESAQEKIMPGGFSGRQLPGAETREMLAEAKHGVLPAIGENQVHNSITPFTANPFRTRNDCCL